MINGYGEDHGIIFYIAGIAITVIALISVIIAMAPLALYQRVRYASR
jgi:hypothetical protein